jgi:hypothetical protein
MFIATETEYPLKTVQVIEKEHGVSRSRFMCMRPAAFVIDCETDDDACCTKALRAVSGSENAIHPRDWPAAGSFIADSMKHELASIVAGRHSFNRHH